MFKKNNLRIISIIVLLAFTLTYGLPTQQVAYAQQMPGRTTQSIAELQKAANQKKLDKPKTETQLGNYVEELCILYENLKQAVKQQEKEQIKQEIQRFKKVVEEVQQVTNNEFIEIEKTTQGLQAKDAQERYRNYKNEFHTKIKDLDVLLDTMYEAVESGTELDKIVDKIGQWVYPEREHQPIDELPHNKINMDSSAPNNFENRFFVKVNYSMEVGEELLKLPIDADLAETKEVFFAPEIVELADRLGTPLAMYEYVKNNIHFRPYYGSRKGAIGTLEQKSGNAFDQASLLLAMLRYKGIPSRYKRGVVEVSIEKAMGWTGAETPEAAVKILGSLGIPTVGITSDGKISAVRLEHIWIEAYLPYELYRGVGEGKGQKVWVPLDPSFKQYELMKGLSISSIIGLHEEQYDNLRGKTIMSLEDHSILRVDVDDMQHDFEDAEKILENYLKQNGYEDATLEEVFGGKRILPEHLGLLPIRLPYKTVSVLDEFQEIPNEFVDTITFSIGGESPFEPDFTGSEDFIYKIPASDAYGKKITLSWAPATSEDESIINYYGDIFKTPAYLVKMKPQLKIDGHIVAEGKSVGLGYQQEFKIQFQSIGILDTPVINTVTVGGFYNVGLNYGNVSEAEIRQIYEKIESLKTTINETNIYTDEAMGEILNAIAKSYFAQLDLYDMLLSGQYNVETNRLLSAAITGYNIHVKYMFRSPVEINEGSMYIDVDRDIKGVVSRDGKSSTESEYMFISGVYSSAMEHRIFEQMTGVPAVSTIKIFEEANERGVPLYTINQENIHDLLPKLEVGDATRRDIQDAVNANRFVMIPQRNIQYYDWNGIGYLIFEPETGAAAYMISGGIAGGAMSAEEVLSRYVDYVLTGLIGMVLYELAEIILVALLPGGWVTGIIWGVRILMVGFAIRNALTLFSLYQATGDPLYLQEMLIQLSAICTLGLIRKGPMKDFFAETAALKDAVLALKKSGVSTQTALNLLKTYGIGKVNQVKEVVGTFQRYGFTENQLMRLSKSFDPHHIAIIDNTCARIGIVTSAEAEHILILFKEPGTITQATSLSGNIINLHKTGISPSQYSQYGIAGMSGVTSTAKAIDQGITLFNIKRLLDLGIKSTEYEHRGIGSPIAAEATIHFSRAAFFPMPMFAQQIDKAVQPLGISTEYFQQMKMKLAIQLTENEKNIMRKVRESIEVPQETTIFQKVIHQTDIENYMKEKEPYKEIGGFVTRAQDTKHLGTLHQVYESLRLDYDETPFKPDTDPYYGVIRFTTEDTDYIQIPYGPAMGGASSYPDPFTGHGFIKSMNGDMIPEYKIDPYVEPMEGAVLFKVNSQTGEETLIGIYNGERFIAPNAYNQKQ